MVLVVRNNQADKIVPDKLVPASNDAVLLPLDVEAFHPIGLIGVPPDQLPVESERLDLPAQVRLPIGRLEARRTDEIFKAHLRRPGAFPQNSHRCVRQALKQSIPCGRIEKRLAPTVEDVARATSSTVIPATFNIVITSRCGSGRVATKDSN